ncbi:zinc-binding dehydrogenase [Spirillospora sp. CA-253888]
MAALLPRVRTGGALVSITGPVAAPPGSPVETAHFVARNDVARLAELVALVDAGAVRVDAAVRPLAEAAAVRRDAEAGRVRGMVVPAP